MFHSIAAWGVWAVAGLFGLVLGFDCSCGCLICGFIVLVIGVCGLIAVCGYVFAG